MIGVSRDDLQQIKDYLEGERQNLEYQLAAERKERLVLSNQVTEVKNQTTLHGNRIDHLANNQTAVQEEIAALRRADDDRIDAINNKLDRTPTSFALTKGRPRKHMPEIGWLQLKSTDPGRRCTLYRPSDDKAVEVNLTVNEPKQIYCGRDIYCELTATKVDRKTCTGFLLLPKNINRGWPQKTDKSKSPPEMRSPSQQEIQGQSG